MKIRSLYNALLAILIASFAVSCDDDIDSLGQSIRPDTDDIALEIDSIHVSAKTVSLKDYIYVENERVLLGEVKDKRFGSLKADFMGEYSNAGGKDVQFKLGYDNKARVDSVQLRLMFNKSHFMGDTVATTVVSVYEVTKSLEANYYTNIIPSEYCDKKRLLGQRFFSIQGLSRLTSNLDVYEYELNVELDKKYGQDLYEEWVKTDGKVLSSTKTLREFMKGIYVTTDLNDNAILQFPNVTSSIYTQIFYSYTLKKKHEPDEDSTAVGSIALPLGHDAIKMNRVVNTPWENGIIDIEGNNDNKVRTLVKAPAGVMTEISIPLARIKEKGQKKLNSDKFSLNSAIFKLMGLTEEENELSITQRPNYLLFLDKDSLPNFFNKKKKVDGVSSLIMVRDTTNNSYNFFSSNNNLSTSINHYLKQDTIKQELKFLVIPISASVNPNSATVESVENLLQPAAAIFRTDEKHTKISLAFSKHNDDIIK